RFYHPAVRNNEIAKAFPGSREVRSCAELPWCEPRKRPHREHLPPPRSLRPRRTHLLPRALGRSRNRPRRRQTVPECPRTGRPSPVRLRSLLPEPPGKFVRVHLVVASS